MPDQLTIGGLFAGYGGLDLAVEAVTGARPAWFCEWDDAPSKILAHHWPDVPNYRDVTTVNWSEVPPVDIICGGSPCQDLSLAGARKGMTEGTRSNLWVSMREAIATIRPRLVVWENVRGALSANATSASDMEPGSGLLGGGAGYLRALGRVLGDLATLGYDAQWCLIRASEVGAPHHRARVFLVAHPADTERVGLEEGQQPRQGIPSLAGTHGGVGALSDGLTHLPTPNASDGTGGGQTPDKRTGHSRQLIDAVLDLGAQPYLPTPTCADSDRERNNPAQAKRHSPPLSATLAHFDDTSIFGKYEPVVHRWEQVTGMEAPAPTELNKNGKPRLNAAFAEWMMGLPSGWITAVPGVTRAQQLKACGNGVVPQQAAAALTHLLEVARHD